MLDHAALKAALHYDPETGVWTWPTGRRADHWDSPAQRVRLGKTRYSAAKLAWFYVTGTQPRGLIVFQDGDRTNTSFDNLRLSNDDKHFTQEELKKTLSYDPNTGAWIRLERTSPGCAIGVRIDKPSIARCNCVSFRSKLYKAHILAWFYMTGEWPVEDIDHKNTNPFDNTWQNLRLATDSQNLGNRTKQRNNTSGYKGVTWVKEKQKWKAQIGFQGVNYHVGYADSPAEAHALYAEKAVALFGEFARAS